MIDTAARELLQYGAVGLMAILAITGLMWSQRQFVEFLKQQVAAAATEREHEREERRLWRGIITEIQTTVRDQVAALRDHTDQERAALRDLSETMRDIRRA